MNIRVFDDLESLSRFAADEVVRRVESRLRSAIILSGGSTPRRLYELLGSMPRRPRLAARELVWIVGDERLVPPDHPDSNARMIRETLFALGIPPGHSFLRFRTELGDPARIAREMEADLRAALAGGPPDLAILGVGTDGHTASLFPGTEALDESARWAVEVRVPQLDAWRLTITLTVLRSAAERWILAAGAEKRAVIERLMEGADLPVAKLLEAEGPTWWLADREAWDPEPSLERRSGSR
ncbi:MAG TPA: 6-phosphogluconolactonase [Thermoanaerobaculia bacterium]|nr:6-phosphogluconolactonase [Thermoanaerobaculia bacterium]